jgi:hypothetical protein
MKEADGPLALPANPEEEKLPYQKPAVAWEETLEQKPSLMAGCGKQVDETSECSAAPGAS